MKLYVIEILKTNGKPYKEARFSDMGFQRELVEAELFETEADAQEWVDIGTEEWDRPCRMRTLALLPIGEEKG